MMPLVDIMNVPDVMPIPTTREIISLILFYLIVLVVGIRLLKRKK
ncbi:hypothetical protein SAMN04487969_1556 [Paenibacillus algorifonticola]|uniref:Uncharacterized protein n=1 Tax=Paenibacillus algorifonticola TaxID=684063 RepID=A0A1I2J812_9BACL|nr:hypothetical protein [Paenibacillus algorifonticola]SFF49347.1 hypothetical protein SAMN04487969_1556 [Paenibacillus algorifonticola]